MTALLSPYVYSSTFIFATRVLQVWGKTGSKLYGPDTGADFADNHKRFSMFCKAAIEAARVGVGEVK